VIALKELGKIIRVEDDRAVIHMDARGGCKSCGMNAYCHATGTGRRELRLGLGGKEYAAGDIVEIETPARSLLTAAFLVFILPLILSITMYFIVFSITGSTGYGLLGFFGCFVLAEFLITWIDKAFGRRRFFEPRIVRRIDGSL
jgi:positive regulator of sigma E activity